MLASYSENTELFSKKVYKKFVLDRYGVKSFGPAYSRGEMDDIKLTMDLIKNKFNCTVKTELEEIEFLPEENRYTNVYNIYQNIRNEGGLSYTHVQSMASNLWVITHGMAFFPNVTTEDDNGNDIEGIVTYVSNNQVNITFSEPVSGIAYLS